MHRTFAHALTHFTLVAAFLLAQSTAWAGSTPNGDPLESERAAASVVPQGEDDPGASPRAAMRAYLEACRASDYERAARFLDLSSIPSAQRAEEGPTLARHLKVVLDQVVWIDLELLSEEADGQIDDSQPNRDRVAEVKSKKGSVYLYLQRTPGGAGVPSWRFSTSTVAHIPALYDEFGFGVLAEILPRNLIEVRFLEVSLWQWIGILILVLLATFGSWIAVRALYAALKPVVARTDSSLDDRMLDLTVGPVRFLIGLLLFSLGLLVLRLALPVHEFLQGLQKGLGVVAFAWLFMRLVDVLAGVLRARLQNVGKQSALTVLPLGEKAIKVAVVGLAALMMLQNLGFNITGVLAGLGVGGLAVALAAQKTVENLFGGVSLIMDQPVRVGDFCRYGDKVGTVEDVGLRSTKIRSLDRTVVTIPNADFAYLPLENFARRDKIRFATKLGLRYETSPDQLRLVLAEIRKLFLSHPRVDPQPARVRFVGYGDFSLDIELFAFVTSTDINEYLGIQEDLLLGIMDIVNASGTGFAFPSSTTYLARDSGLDKELTRAAEARVRGWREKHELPFPDYADEAKQAMDDSLPWPPQGSALAGQA